MKEVWNATNRQPSASHERASWRKVTAEHTKIVEAMAVGNLSGARGALEEHLVSCAADLAGDAARIAPMALAAQA